MTYLKSVILTILIGLTFTANSKTLSVASVNNVDMLRMKELSNLFEAKNPGVELEWNLMDEAQLRKVVHQNIQKDKASFDVVMIGTYDAPIYGKNGWLEPMVNLPPDYDVEDLFQSVRAGLSYKGELFALPLYAESSVTMYRVDLLNKAGLHVPDYPTWEFIQQAAAKIHDPENEVYGICLRGKGGWGNNIALISTIANSHGGQWFDVNWKPVLDSPEWEKSLTLYTELLTKYGPPDAYNNGYTENLALMSQGHCGIWIDSTVAGTYVANRKKSKYADDIYFAPPPHQVTSKGSGWLWAWALAVPEKSANKELARQFALWATSKDYARQVVSRYGIKAIPPGARRSTYYDPDYLKIAPFALGTLEQLMRVDPNDSTLNENPYTGIQYVAIPHFREFGDQLGELFSDVLKGKLSVSESLSLAQEIVEEQAPRSR